MDGFWKVVKTFLWLCFGLIVLGVLSMFGLLNMLV